MYTPLSVPPPGLMKPPTPRLSPGRWNDGNLVRWVNGYPRPFAGWETVNTGTFGSNVRAIHRWRDLNAVDWVAYLCDGHLYAMSKFGFYDIGPIDPVLASAEGDVDAGGYGTFNYGEGEYNTPRPPVPRALSIGPVFTLSNWGDNLVAMTNVDGRLLIWDPKTPEVKAKKVANSPLGRTFVVTPERFVVMFGVDGDARKFRWCDQENITNWNMADVTSKAGEFDVEPSAPILSAVQVPAGTLFATSIGWYIVKFIGLPYVYSYEPLFEGAPPVSAASVVPYGDGAVWISDSEFYTFNGVEVRPIACDLKNWFKERVNPARIRFRTIGMRLDSTGEIWWSFSERGSDENNLCIIWSFTDGWWTKAAIGRTAGENSSHTAYPEMAFKKEVYKHESGVRYPGAKELPYIETGVFNSGRGGVMSMLRRILTDVGDTARNFAVSIRCRDFNNRSGETVTPSVVPDAKGVANIRVSGRDFRLRLESLTDQGSLWTYGDFMVDLVPRGQRSGKI